MINGFNWRTVLGAAAVVAALTWYTAPASTNETKEVQVHTCHKNELAKEFVKKMSGQELLVVDEKQIGVFHRVLFGKDVKSIVEARVYHFKNVVRIIGFYGPDCIGAWIDIYPHQWEDIKVKFKDALRGV